jgi:hypothetical protein
MKKNFSLRIFNLLAKRVYKLSKKRKLGWKWHDAQRWTSANLFKQYKGKPISKIRLTDVDKNIISILEGATTPTPTPTPTPKPTVCSSPFEIPTKNLKDINWWMLEDAVFFFNNNLKIRVVIDNIIDTGIVHKFELPSLKDTIEDMRKQGFSSDDYIIFKILVAPNMEDDGKPCSYYLLVTTMGSNADTQTFSDEIVKVVSLSDLPASAKKELEEKNKKIQEIREARESKKKAIEKQRPTKVEGQDEAEKQQIQETLKNLEELYNKKLISKELFQANVKELKNKLSKGGKV